MYLCIHKKEASPFLVKNNRYKREKNDYYHHNLGLLLCVVAF